MSTSTSEGMRIDYAQIEPDLIRRFRELTRDLSKMDIQPALRALVELRVSQINGCHYCIGLHRAEARAHGETPERLVALSNWSESDLFTPREKTALRWAEAITQTGRLHEDEDEYAALRAEFSEKEIVALGIIVANSNFWNRMAGGFRKPPAHPLE